MALVRKHTVIDGLTVPMLVDPRSTHVVWTRTVDAWLEYGFARSADGARRAATARMLRSGARIITELHDLEGAA